MRVLHIAYAGHEGGIARFLEHLFIAQKESLDPALGFGNAKGPLWEKAQSQAWLAYDLGIKRAWPVNPLRLKRAERIFRGFDVLHFHYFHPGLARAALATDARIVFTEHGMFDDDRPWIKRYLKTKAKREFLARDRVRVVANSRFTASRIREHYGTEALVVPVGEFISEIRPKRSRQEVRKELGLAREDFVVAYSGRLARVKRIDRLTDATRGLPVKLLMVGDGPERKRLPAGAIVTGFVDVPFDYMAAADILIMPRAGEPFGLSAVEAMALGVPVLCFEDGGGVCEILSGHPDLVAQDPGDMRERIRRFLEDPDELRYLGESLKPEALKYDIVNIAKAYEVLYR